MNFDMDSCRVEPTIDPFSKDCYPFLRYNLLPIAKIVKLLDRGGFVVDISGILVFIILSLY